MNPVLGVFIMMNNYFHDVATAMLLASAVTVWIVYKKYSNSGHPEVISYFLGVYRGITRLAKVSLAWILIGGIPRTVFYRDFEWANAAGKNQVPALIVKHALAVVFVGTGAFLWLKIRRRVKEIEGRGSMT